MRMIFDNDTLYVDIEGEVGQIEMNYIKKRVFSVLDQYEVGNVIVNTKNVFNNLKIKSLVKEYKDKYNGNFLVVNK